MLEVRYGTADKSHENSFFRYFASQTKEYFEKVGIDGILVGMPECLVMGNLQIDALLLTDSSLTIIDFKNYEDCEVFLPDESDFERGRWETNIGCPVRGGSSPNPYGQLMLQRRRLKEILNRFCRHKLGEFNASHISTMVCFAGKTLISGEIPGWARLKFFIADSDNFLQKLYDIVNVRSVDLLKSDFVLSEFEKLFESQPYECDIKPSKPFVEEESRKPALEIPDVSTDVISNFFADDSDVLIVSSVDAMERRKLALVIQDAAHDAHFDEAMILSSTKLAGDNLCGDLALDGSLYSEIYDFSSRHRNKEGVELINLAKPLGKYSLRDEALDVSSSTSEGSTDANNAERFVFIVCESQLVSSNAWLDGSVIFGSGRLLNDVLQYLSINTDNKGKNKIVFIGDDCQLGSSSVNYSSMHAEAYPQGISIKEYLIPLDDTFASSSKFSLRIASDIRSAKYALLTTDKSDDVISVLNHEDERSLIESAVDNWRGHKIISYTNEQANQINLFIKRSILRNGENISVGDVIVFNGQFEALNCSPVPDNFPTRAIRNGEFAVVTHVGEPVMRMPVTQKNDANDESITLLYIRFALEGSGEEYEAFVIEEYLYSSKAELSSEQEIAIKIALSEMERSAQERNPFGPGNPWFEEMIQANNYIEVENENGKISYRQKTDRRSLTPQERSYRAEITKQLESPGTKYFLLANAAKARFGWALTAHKAQSYLWDHVTLSANAHNLGRHTEQYFRFLYTGSSRAKEGLSLVRWRDITPFDETNVIHQSVANTSSSTKQILLQIDEGISPSSAIASFLDGIQLDGIVFNHIGSSDYQERFEIMRDDTSTVVAFSYNKKREVGLPIRQKGDIDLYSSFKEAISSTSDDSLECTPMLDAYDYLVSVLGDDARIKVVRSTAYRDELEIKLANGMCHAVSYYNAKGLVSRLERLDGDIEVFHQLESSINHKEAS